MSKHLTHTHLYLLSLIIISLFSPATAETTVPTLPKVIIQAPSQAPSNQYPRIKSLMDRSLITKKNINEQQYQTVTQAIQSLPGLVVIQSGNEGQQSSLFIRGTNSNHNQVRRDGMKLVGTDIYSGAFNFGTLETSDLESIEVVRGPVTSLYGADAPGGVILLTTPVGTGSSTEKFSLEGGSRESFKAKGELQGEILRTNLYMNATRSGTGGYTQTPQKYRIADGDYRKIPYHQTLGTLRLGQQINDATNISFINSFTRNELKTQWEKTVSTKSEETSFHRLLLNQKTEALESVWGAGYTQTQSHEDKGHPKYLKSHLSRFQLDGRTTWALTPNHGLTASAEWGQDRIKTANPSKTPKNTFKDQETQIGGGLLYRWINSPFVLESSVRVDHLAKNKTYPTYRASGRYEFIPNTWLTLSYGTAIKEPTLTQRFQKTTYVNPNPHLTAEKIRSYEISISRYWTDNLKTEVIYFHNDLNNMIAYYFNAKTFGNINKAISKGVEVMLKYQIIESLCLEGNYTYTHAKDTEQKKWLLRRPFNKWSTRLTYERNELTTSIEYIYIGKRADIHPVTYNRKTAKGYSQLGLRVEKNYSSQTRFYGRVENCLNDHRETPLGFRRAGFGVFAGLEMKFG